MRKTVWLRISDPIGRRLLRMLEIQMRIDPIQVLTIGLMVSGIAHWDRACSVLGICLVAYLVVKGLS